MIFGRHHTAFSFLKSRENEYTYIQTYIAKKKLEQITLTLSPGIPGNPGGPTTVTLPPDASAVAGFPGSPRGPRSPLVPF